MEENLSWKIIFIATSFSLLILGFAYFLISPQESEFFNPEKTEKIAEFNATRFAGRKDGKKIWEFFAQEGWTAKDRVTTHLKNVSKGKIFQDEKIVVLNLSAPRVKTFRGTEIVEAFGPVKAYINLGRISNPNEERPSEWTKMTANYLKHFPQEKRSEIRENVVFHKKDSSIYAQEMIVDHDKKTTNIKGDVSLKREDATLRSDNMQYISNQEKLIADGNIDIKIRGGSLKTNLKCDHASFFTDIKKDMRLQGNLKVVQGKKIAVAESGVYSQKRKELVMQRSVKAVFEKARAILKEESVKNLKNPEAKKILREKTILTSQELVFSTKTGDAKASGSVFVSQKGREARADHAEYNEKKEILTLSGNVFMKKGNAWVKAKEVFVSIRKETFEARGAVEAEFNL